MVRYITELLVDDAWLDITPDVRDSSPIIMERGRRDWATDTDPATCSLKLNNGASKAAAGVFGRYSPRNPRSDLFEKIGRNTPVRVRRDATPELFMELPSVEGSNASTPDTSALDVTGTLDIRIEIEPQAWQPKYHKVLASKWSTENNQRSWCWALGGDIGGIAGRLEFKWSDNGTNEFRELADTTLPTTSGRLALRVTRNSSTGDVIFYTSDSLSGTWTQLGATQGSSASSHFSSSSPVVVGQADDTTTSYTPFQGKIYGFRFLSGIGGTAVANPDFDLYEPEVRSFTDPAGRVWTLNDSATFVNPLVRFTGEAKSWPLQWDLSGADQWVSLTVAGITRRLQRGKKPFKSSIFRDLSIDPDIVAYWPMEEPRGATEFASGLPGVGPTLAPQVADEVTFSADDEVFFASDALPTVEDTSIVGLVPSYTASTYQRFGFLIDIPEDVIWADDKVIARVYSSGSARRWDILKLAAPSTNGNLITYDKDGVELDNETIALPLIGVPAGLSLMLSQDGTAVDWQVSVIPLDGSTGATTNGTVTSNTVGRMTRVVLGTSNSTGMEETIFGHAHIWNRAREPFWDPTLDIISGWTRETGLERLVRLSSDEGLPPVRAIGLNDDHREPAQAAIFSEWEPPATITEKMGPQLIATLMDLFREVAITDLGILTDRPDAVGLQYRSRIDLYNQEPTLVLDYSQGVIDEPFRPIDDDQNIVNEITVERPRGSSFTAADTTGPLSSLDPPFGVGLYDETQDVNVESDQRLPDQAYWRLHLGTIDEARFPVLSLNLRNPRVAALEESILALREGDLIRIENPPKTLPGGPYNLLVEAIHEEKTAVTHQIEFACSPGSAWGAFILDDTGEANRLDTGGSSLVTDITATQVLFDVATDAGSQRWIEVGSLQSGITVDLPGASGSDITTPNPGSGILTGTNAVDIRIRVAPATWTPAGQQVLVSKWQTGQLSWYWRLNANGTLTWVWTSDGTSAVGFTSTNPVPSVADGEYRWIRVLFAPDYDGQGRIGFYTSVDGVNWSNFYFGLITATSIAAGTAEIALGARLSGTDLLLPAQVSSLEVSQGYDGTVANSTRTVIGNPDFTAQTLGATSFVDGAGLTWTLGGDSEFIEVDTEITPTNDPFQIMVAGEVMEIQAISGTSSPQEFAVRRAINGVAKSHTAGARVSLAKTYYLSL